MLRTLDGYQRRVLGVLIEKALAQPAYYPMTLAAVTAACNQKNNRDPLMELAEETVYDTLEQLRGMGLVVRAMTSGGRTDRFRHLAPEVYGWDGRQRAIMAELLLRGPQTVGELRTRAARMTALETTDDVAAVLESLQRLEPPHAAQLPRQPGQSAIRWTHLLYPLGEAPPAAAEAAAPGVSPTPAPPPAAAAPAGDVRAELEALQGELADLHQALADLRRRVERLES